MPHQVELQLVSEIRPDRLAETARHLALELDRQPALTAGLLPAPSTPGERGGDGMLFQLLLTFLTGGAAKALLDTLARYFENDSTLSVHIKAVDGSEIKIEGSDLRPENVVEMIHTLQSLNSR